ncbi:Uncharacterised protein [Vibrio cholerae]|nr:Uncharacterised protein [Vibrio cholerae]
MQQQVLFFEQSKQQGLIGTKARAEQDCSLVTKPVTQLML